MHDETRTPKFNRFWSEVDAQLASLGYQGAWINEIRPFYADGVSVAATAACIADARDEDGFRESQFNRDRREHGLSAAQLGVNGQ